MNGREGLRGISDLSGASAVITGASSGIGRAIAVELASAGANLLVTCRSSHDRLRETVSEVAEAGAQVMPFVGDLSDPRVCEELVAKAWEYFGGVAIWINNAGADLLTGQGATLTFDEKLLRLFEVDVRATMLLTRSVGAKMKDVGKGVILNVGWDQADQGMEGDSGELFAAAKNAVMGFTRSSAMSLAPEVRVNCIAPGWIKTAWGETASDYWQQRVIHETPLRRWGTPEDIAKAARFLCSDDASFITGQILNVNGGAVR